MPKSHCLFKQWKHHFQQDWRISERQNKLAFTLSIASSKSGLCAARDPTAQYQIHSLSLNWWHGLLCFLAWLVLVHGYIGYYTLLMRLQQLPNVTPIISIAYRLCSLQECHIPTRYLTTTTYPDTNYCTCITCIRLNYSVEGNLHVTHLCTKNIFWLHYYGTHGSSDSLS